MALLKALQRFPALSPVQVVQASRTACIHSTSTTQPRYRRRIFRNGWLIAQGRLNFLL